MKKCCKNCLFWTERRDLRWVRSGKSFVAEDGTLWPSFHEASKAGVRLRREDLGPQSMYNTHLDKKGPWGQCGGIVFRHNLRDAVTVTRPEDFYYNQENTNAVCEDASSYSARVETCHTFSCANFKPR